MFETPGSSLMFVCGPSPRPTPPRGLCCFVTTSPSNPTSLGTSSPCSLCPQLHPQSGCASSTSSTSTSSLLGFVNDFLREDSEVDDVGPEDQVRPLACVRDRGRLLDVVGALAGSHSAKGHHWSSAAMLSSSLCRGEMHDCQTACRARPTTR